MTYNEILVGLTVHTNREFKCDKCTYYDYDNCADSLMTDALELILNQKFEIKRLENADDTFQDGLNEVKAEAIKEFACPNTCIDGIEKWLESEVEENDGKTV